MITLQISRKYFNFEVILLLLENSISVCLGRFSLTCFSQAFRLAASVKCLNVVLEMHFAWDVFLVYTPVIRQVCMECYPFQH